MTKKKGSTHGAAQNALEISGTVTESDEDHGQFPKLMRLYHYFSNIQKQMSIKNELGNLFFLNSILDRFRILKMASFIQILDIP